MTRRKRLRQCKFWRAFISEASKQTDMRKLRKLIFSMSEVESISIEHGWTTWVTVVLKNGETFLEREFFPIDSLKIIAQQLYRYAVNEYLEYIKYK
jgi:hypothetical protein